MQNRNSYLSALGGIVLGIVGFTFLYADGGSYLSNDPAACVNCHVMRPQMDAWVKGSHARVATCNDCHAPHDNLPAKLAIKALNGFNHSLAFTTGRFQEPMRATDLNRRVTEAACRHCHEPLIHATPTLASGDLSCIRCHDGVGHRTRD